jgi:hypothetical protein
VVLLGRSTRNRSCWTSWTYGRKRWSWMGSLCRLLREPQGPSVHGLSLLCSCTCAAETRSAHPRSLLQDRRAWPQPLCTAPVLLPHHWPLACLRMVYCLACARACGNEPAAGGTPSLAPCGCANPILPGPSGPATPPSSPPAVTPSGPAYHHRRSCATRRTHAALLLPRPPHG